MLSRRTLLLKPMQTAVSGYARLQAENDRMLVQLHARSLNEGQVRLFALTDTHAAREVSSTQVNVRGEASIETEAPANTQALILMAMPPKPLLIGLCGKQDADTVLDVKNSALALAQKLQPAKQRPPEPKPEPPPKAEPKQTLPREIFLPAIDPTPYTKASVPKEEPQPILPPPKPSGPPVERLRKLIWPRSFEGLRRYFDSAMPCALLPLKGWRFVQASGGLWLGMQAQDGRVQRVAYAYAEAPKELKERCQNVRGMDGQMYQVRWMKI